jgi:hypothetical protein
MHHGFDCFSRKHEQEEQKHHWLGVRGTSQLSKLEGGRTCDFVGEDDRIGWRGCCGENCFTKNIRIKFHEDCPLVIFF